MIQHQTHKKIHEELVSLLTNQLKNDNELKAALFILTKIAENNSLNPKQTLLITKKLLTKQSKDITTIERLVTIINEHQKQLSYTKEECLFEFKTELAKAGYQFNYTINEYLQADSLFQINHITQETMLKFLEEVTIIRKERKVIENGLDEMENKLCKLRDMPHKEKK